MTYIYPFRHTMATNKTDQSIKNYEYSLLWLRSYNIYIFPKQNGIQRRKWLKEEEKKNLQELVRCPIVADLFEQISPLKRIYKPWTSAVITHDREKLPHKETRERISYCAIYYEEMGKKLNCQILTFTHTLIYNFGQNTIWRLFNQLPNIH